MTTSRFLLFSVLCVAVAALAATPASAQDTPDPQEFGDELLVLLDRQVDLTPQQATRVRPVLRAHADRVIAILPERRSRTAMMRIRGQVGDIQEATTERLMPLLTASQREAFDGYWGEVRKVMRERM